MELCHVNLTIPVSVGETDQFTKLFPREGNVEHCENHLEFHVRKDTIAVFVEPGERLSNINALLLQLALEGISERLHLGFLVGSHLLSFLYEIFVMDHSDALGLLLKKLGYGLENVLIFDTSASHVHCSLV